MIAPPNNSFSEYFIGIFSFRRNTFYCLVVTVTIQTDLRKPNESFVRHNENRKLAFFRPHQNIWLVDGLDGIPVRTLTAGRSTPHGTIHTVQYSTIGLPYVYATRREGF